MGRPNAQSQVNISLEFDRSFKEFELGFLKGSNPKAYNRLLNLATLNASRTMIKPMRANAPRDTGRLRKSVSAKKGRYQQPSATVGPRPGKSRGDTSGAWYRWMVTSGHKVRGVAPAKANTSWSAVASGATVSAVTSKKVPAQPFVTQTAKQGSVMQRAMDAYYGTIEKFYNDSLFRGRILKFKRKGR